MDTDRVQWTRQHLASHHDRHKKEEMIHLFLEHFGNLHRMIKTYWKVFENYPSLFWSYPNSLQNRIQNLEVPKLTQKLQVNYSIFVKDYLQDKDASALQIHNLNTPWPERFEVLLCSPMYRSYNSLRSTVCFLWLILTATTLFLPFLLRTINVHNLAKISSLMTTPGPQILNYWS